MIKHIDFKDLRPPVRVTIWLKLRTTVVLDNPVASFDLPFSLKRL